MSRTFHLRVDARPENLAELRSFAQAAVTGFGMAGEPLADLLVALDEAATNIMVHGYRGQGGPLDLHVEKTGDGVTLRLIDEAPPFDPTRSAPADPGRPLEDREIGGMGVHLMRTLMDAVAYRKHPSGNEIVMTKRIAPA